MTRQLRTYRLRLEDRRYRYFGTRSDANYWWRQQHDKPPANAPEIKRIRIPATARGLSEAMDELANELSSTPAPGSSAAGVQRAGGR